MENKIITMYELIGLIKDDKAPKQIKYYNEILKKTKEDGVIKYISIDSEDIDLNFEFIVTHNLLNNKLEILPKKNGDWEDIEEIKLIDESIEVYDTERHLITTNRKDRDIYIVKINQLIKNQKYLKERLENKDELK